MNIPLIGIISFIALIITETVLSIKNRSKLADKIIEVLGEEETRNILDNNIKGGFMRKVLDEDRTRPILKHLVQNMLFIGFDGRWPIKISESKLYLFINKSDYKYDEFRGLEKSYIRHFRIYQWFKLMPYMVGIIVFIIILKMFL